MSMRASGGSYRRETRATEWAVENFKALEHVDLPMAGLVVLTGANSSGKSSLVQSLLLLAQSTDDEIILNGPLVRLGEPADVIRSGHQAMTVGWTTSVRDRPSRGQADVPDGEAATLQRRCYDFSVSLHADGSELRVNEFNAAVDGEAAVSASTSRVTREVATQVNPDDAFGDALLRITEIGGRPAPPRTYLTFRGFYPEAVLVRRRASEVLAMLRRDFRRSQLRKNPDRAFTLIDELGPWVRNQQIVARERKIDLSPGLAAFAAAVGRPGAGASPARLAYTLEDSDLNAAFEAFTQALGEEEWVPVPISRYHSMAYRPYSQRASFATHTLDLELMRALTVGVDALRSIRESIRYLGPLREEPQVVSATGGRNRTATAGPKGEYTADLLAREKRTSVEFRDWSRVRRRELLPEAVTLWTTYLGVGEAVAVEDQGKLGRGLRILVNGVERDLTTVGVGASQVLPVLAVVLAAPRGSVVMLEQPELHLHPAVQSRLADFFAQARPDITLIIETHSEYLITRLRRRAAERELNPSQVTIMFAEQLAGSTSMRRIEIGATGDLSAWPSGFFDTQDEESRALVQAVYQRIGETRSEQ